MFVLFGEALCEVWPCCVMGLKGASCKKSESNSAMTPHYSKYISSIFFSSQATFNIGPLIHYSSSSSVKVVGL